jgi:hypothetical protein
MKSLFGRHLFSRFQKSSVIEYIITQNENRAHKATMQQVDEDEKRERKSINDKKERAIEAARKACMV